MSECVSIVVVRQRLGKNVLVAQNTSKNEIIFGRIIFYAVCFLPSRISFHTLGYQMQLTMLSKQHIIKLIRRYNKKYILISG
jgi:hypothetical protein